MKAVIAALAFTIKSPWLTVCDSTRKSLPNVEVDLKVDFPSNFLNFVGFKYSRTTNITFLT